MELHVIIPGRAPDLVARVVDGRAVIVPPVRPLPAPPIPAAPLAG
jgi:hypothetical protein